MPHNTVSSEPVPPGTAGAEENLTSKDTTMPGRRCSYEKDNGEQCRANARKDDPDGRCWAHSEAFAEERAEAQRRGGRTRAEQLRPPEIEVVFTEGAEPILRLLERATEDLLARRRDPTEVRAIGYIVGHALRVIEVGEIEERLEAVEAAIQRQRMRRTG